MLSEKFLIDRTNSTGLFSGYKVCSSWALGNPHRPVCKNMHVLLLTAKKKAKKLSSYVATYGDGSVNLQ